MNLKKSLTNKDPTKGYNLISLLGYIINSPRQFPTKIPKVEYDNSFEKPEKLKLMEL